MYVFLPFVKRDRAAEVGITTYNAVIRDKDRAQAVLEGQGYNPDVSALYELVPVSLMDVEEVVTTTRKVIP
jgi:hypothetical protein